MEFRCRLGTASGEVLEGVYVADDEAKLRRELDEKGLHVLSLRRRGARGWPALSFSPSRRIRSREFLVFNQELAALLKAGMPLVQSLEILRQRVETPGFKLVLDDVHERVRGGAALSEAFEAQEAPMPSVYTASLMAGEKSGSLEVVLRRYVTYARVISSVRRKTISALIYPAILLALSLIVVGIIVLRVGSERRDAQLIGALERHLLRGHQSERVVRARQRARPPPATADAEAGEEVVAFQRDPSEARLRVGLHTQVLALRAVIVPTDRAVHEQAVVDAELSLDEEADRLLLGEEVVRRRNHRVVHGRSRRREGLAGDQLPLQGLSEPLHTTRELEVQALGDAEIVRGRALQRQVAAGLDRLRDVARFVTDNPEHPFRSGPLDASLIPHR